jgi:hypothetical protein
LFRIAAGRKGTNTAAKVYKATAEFPILRRTLLQRSVVVCQTLLLLLLRLLGRQEDVVLLKMPVRSILEAERFGFVLVGDEFGVNDEGGLHTENGVAVSTREVSERER